MKHPWEEEEPEDWPEDCAGPEYYMFLEELSEELRKVVRRNNLEERS